MNKEKLESAKNLFFIALGIDIAVTALVVISDVWGTGVLKDIGAGRTTADQSTISTFEFWDSFSKLTFLTILGVGLALVKWLNTCYNYAKETIGASGFKNERWTAGGWIIPIFNLFKPYQVINEIYKAGSSTYSGPADWKKEGGSGLLLIWWIFWAVTHFIGLTVGKQMFKNAMRDDLTLQQSISAIEFHALFCVVFLIISGLWFLVAGNLTRRLLARQRVGGATIFQAQPIAVSQSVPSWNPSPTVPAAPPPGSTQLSASQAARTTSQATPNAVQFVNQAQTPTPMPLSSSTEEDFWATAMAEVETGQRRPGVWAKAFAESDGDETKAKVAYLKARVRQLMDAAKASAAQQEVERSEAIEQGQRDALAAEQEIKKLVAQFESTGTISKQELKFLINNGPMAWLVKLRSYELGGTLLHLCAKNEMIEEVKALLMAGADPYRSNKLGESPISMTTNSLILQLCNGLKVSQVVDDNCHGRLEREHLKVHAEQQILVTHAVTKFESGMPPTIEELGFLIDAAGKNSSIARISDRLHNNTLLHWCARLQLDRLASVLLRLNADASAINDEGKQAHQLARGTALKTTLASAANRPKGTCPNCSTVMPLTSQGCPKCGAIFEEGAVWKLVPVKI